MEVKRNEDPFEDPWERSREGKRAGVEKNIQNRMRNMERSGTLPKGTTTRTFKDMKKTREAGREGGKMDVTPSGVPVDMARQQRGKNLTKGDKDGSIGAVLEHHPCRVYICHLHRSQ